MKIIKLTSAYKPQEKTHPIYINIDQIGHISRRTGSSETNVGVTTHNNGGFTVKETPEQIIKMINSAK